MYNRHVFSTNPLSRVNTIVTISCRGRVVTNVVSTCDPTPLYYMQLNIFKRIGSPPSLDRMLSLSHERHKSYWQGRHYENVDCGYSLEPPQRGGSNLYPQFMF